MSKLAMTFALVLIGLAHRSDAAAAPADRSSPAVEWNRTLLAMIRTPGVHPATVHPTRSFALLHAAIYDAVNSIDGRHKPYAVWLPRAPRSASQEAAAAVAGYGVLVSLYPAAQATLDLKLNDLLARVADGESKSAGSVIGRTVAEAMLALRAEDGSDAAPVPFVFRDAPGEYQSTPPNFPAQPGFTHWAAVAPFVLERGDQFRPGPPPALTSNRYRDEFNEVKSIGMAGGTQATPEQILIGRFWNGPIQNYWNEIAQTSALAHGLSTAQSARLFAVLNLTFADSAIAFYDAKYAYRFWRPVTAIRAAANDGNAGTTPDPNWLPIVGNTPGDPSYPGAHAVVSAAGAAVLRSFFRTDHFAFEVTSEVVPGARRAFRRFSAADEEATLSRIYAGVHFRSDEAIGHALGIRIAEFALSALSKPGREIGRVSEER